MQDRGIEAEECTELRSINDIQGGNQLGVAGPRSADEEAKLFELAQRKAKWLASSEFVPEKFRGNVSNVLIAINIANRLNIDPLQVMQGIYIVKGKPTWSSQFLIGMFNIHPGFTGINYEFNGDPETDSYCCRAVSRKAQTGDIVLGPYVSMKMAKEEGWFSKPGSKWKTMPDLMLRYRAATFLIRTVAAEIACGMHTREEVEDVYGHEHSSKKKQVSVSKLNYSDENE